ncbi:MAG: hypothetical protein LBB29_01100 [Holosporaceae bacterium]|jgi:hypothetical protein|nr:hypothetical protein [Holosporaceae bacterium]
MSETLTTLLTACSIFVIYFLITKIRELSLQNKKLSNLEVIYQNSLLEKVKLEERCAQLKEMTIRCDSIMSEKIKLEKEIVFLSANLEQEKKKSPGKNKTPG